MLIYRIPLRIPQYLYCIGVCIDRANTNVHIKNMHGVYIFDLWKICRLLEQQAGMCLESRELDSQIYVEIVRRI
jgi:predicted nucleotidyltransferase